MNINTGLNPYNSNFANNVDRTKMSQGQSLTGSITDSLKEGEVFEGSVNSVDNGKVTIGLAYGQTMTARLDEGVSITPGQSVFFEVKSNDGNLVQIRPVSLTGLDANPTLLKALDMANLAVTERTVNMVNSMMQNSMSISPENLAKMNRAMINNPDVELQTLVTMAKHDLNLTPDNVSMFQNYSNDKAVITDNFDTISDMITELMTSDELSTGDVISLNNLLKDVFIPEEVVNQNVEAATAQTEAVVTEPETQTVLNEVNPNKEILTNNPSVIAEDGITFGEAQIVSGDKIVPGQNENIATTVAESGETAETVITNSETQASAEAVNSQELGNTVINNFASEKQIQSFNTILNTLPDFPKDNLQLFSEDGTLKADADIKQVFKEITTYFNDHPDIPKETLNDIIREPLYKGLVKNIISNSFALEPKDVTKAGELSKLYERVLKQTEALEKLVANFNSKAAETIKNQASEIKQNINFMNSASEMYNFVQIPLKMYNQNTDSMLYVRQNKRSSYEAGEEITAFLHFDMEYLGPTDVFISLKETNVGCKWNLADEESMNLIEANLDLLTERLSKKGFTVKSEVVCGEPKTSFVEDFWGEPAQSTENTSDGLVHRYSFDMRA